MTFGLPTAQDAGDVSRDTDGYWCAQPSKDTARECFSRVTKIGDDTNASGRRARWIRSLMAYYALDTTLGGNQGSQLRTGGEMGELLMVRVNQYRSAAQHIINLMTRTALAYELVAHDSSSNAQESQKLAKALLGSLVRTHKMEAFRRLSAEWAVVCDESWVLTTWDPQAGPEGEVEVRADGTIGKRALGDVKIEIFGPQDVFRDIRSTAPERDWHVVRRWVNRWDLVARHVDLKDDILRLATRDQLEGSTGPLWTSLSAKSDEIAMFDLYHRRTEAVPNGRLLRFSDADTVYFDGPLPYAEVPLERVSAGALLDCGASYTSMYDVIGLQDIYDAIWSNVATIADVAGVPNFHAFEGADFQLEELPGGGRLVTSRFVPGAPEGGKPSIMPVPPVPEVHIKLLNNIPTEMFRLLAISDTMRGEVEKGMPGNLVALLGQQTADFYTPLLRSLNDAWERVGQHALDCYSRFADQRRVVEAEGRDKARETMNFMGGDLAGAGRVRVDIGNPLQDSAAGREMLAENLVKMFPGSMSRDDYLEMRRTGRTDPIFDAEASEDALIAHEDEVLSSIQMPAPDMQNPKQAHDFMVALGAQITVDDTDDHPRHIAKHRCILHDPRLRQMPGVVAATHMHIQAHKAQMVQAMAPPPPPQPAPGAGKPPPGPNPTEVPPAARDTGVRPPSPAAPPPAAPPPAIA